MQLVTEEIDQTLLVQDQGNVVDGWTVVDVDHLKMATCQAHRETSVSLLTHKAVKSKFLDEIG